MAMRWYIVHAHSGFEKKVAQTIREQAAQHNITDMFEDVVVPTEEVVEMRRGKKINAERKFFPGYVLVKMELNDESWHLVKNVPKVTGFLGGGGRPQPISDAEAERIFNQVKEGIEHPRSAVIYEVGEVVKIVDGPFASFTGVVDGMDDDKSKLKVSVTIFGRPTPMELDFAQVEKA